MSATQAPAQVPDDVLLEAIFSWFSDDDCLFTMTVLSIAYSLNEGPGKAQLLELVSPHVAECSECYSNVRRTAATTTDPLRRFAYEVLHGMFTQGWTRQGGSFHRRRTPEGWHTRVEFAPDLRVAFHLMEIFEPHDKRERSRLSLEVSDARLYRDERPLLQALDELATNDVQTYGPETDSLHWRSIISDENWEVFVRCQGTSKKIADGWTLHSRYAPLTRKRLGPRLLKWECSGGGEETQNLSLEALKLRDFALRYRPGRSRFSGFLSVGLKQDVKDTFKALGRDPVFQAESLDPQDPTTERFFPEGARPTQEEEILERRELPAAFQSLWQRLDPCQRRILQLRSQGFSDEQIGEQVGLRRETVNRKIQRMKALLRPLLG